MYIQEMIHYHNVQEFRGTKLPKITGSKSHSNLTKITPQRLVESFA